MVAGPGIEPGSGAYETPELPLLYPATIFIVTKRQFLPCKTSSDTALCLKVHSMFPHRRPSADIGDCDQQPRHISARQAVADVVGSLAVGPVINLF